MSYYTMTNKELSLLVRKKLKEAGFTSKDYSVKVRAAGFNTSIDVRVKNPYVRVSEIERIVNQFSELDIDPKTYEVLAGCNVYVHCQYEYGIFDEIRKPFIPKAQEFFNAIKKLTTNECVSIANNNETELFLIQETSSRYKILQLDKDKSNYNFEKYFIYQEEDLATALWRFENLGTIWA